MALPVCRTCLLRRQPCRKFLRKEGFPLVGVRPSVPDGGPVPVAVEARLASHGHDDRQSGPAVPVECRGVDVPAVEVLPRFHAVEEVKGGRIRAAGQELDANVATHPCRRNLELFDRQIRIRKRRGRRGSTYDVDETRQQRRRHQRDRQAREAAGRLRPRECHRRPSIASRPAPLRTIRGARRSPGVFDIPALSL